MSEVKQHELIQGKPLGIKAYGSIPHLPGSRVGPGDHSVHQGQADICCLKLRDKDDSVYVQEKLDGSCCAVCKVNGRMIALGRAGWPAASSPYLQHRLFDKWVWENYTRFDALLQEGERVCGEWLAQAHGTRYRIPGDPFVAFDLMIGVKRVVLSDFIIRAINQNFLVPRTFTVGPIGVDAAMHLLAKAPYGRSDYRPNYPVALDPFEGIVYRVERQGKVDFLAKWLRPDKVDGCYLPEMTGGEPVWNWQPEAQQ